MVTVGWLLFGCVRCCSTVVVCSVLYVRIVLYVLCVCVCVYVVYACSFTPITPPWPCCQVIQSVERTDVYKHAIVCAAVLGHSEEYHSFKALSGQPLGSNSKISNWHCIYTKAWKLEVLKETVNVRYVSDIRGFPVAVCSNMEEYTSHTMTRTYVHTYIVTHPFQLLFHSLPSVVRHLFTSRTMEVILCKGEVGLPGYLLSLCLD